MASYHTRMGYAVGDNGGTEPGWYQIQLDDAGRLLMAQWLPNCPDASRFLAEMRSCEVSSGELDEIYERAQQLLYT